LFHLVGGVVGVAGDVVGVDGDDAERLGGVVAADARQLVAHVLDERAVVADEHQQQRLAAVERCQADRFSAANVGKLERRGLQPQLRHGRFR
jgi:hypothetical protein